MPTKAMPFEKETVRAYLDRCIIYWRERLAEGDARAENYIEAFQSVRMTLFGELLPE